MKLVEWMSKHGTITDGVWSKRITFTTGVAESESDMRIRAERVMKSFREVLAEMEADYAKTATQ